MATSIGGANEAKVARSHQFVQEIELWVSALGSRRENTLLRVAAYEYQFALLALAQGHYRQAFKGLRLRRGPAQRRQRAGVQPQRVAHVIEPKAVGELGIKQADDVTPRRERAGLIGHAGRASQARHQVRRNEVAKLAQQREFAAGWLLVSLFFHALPCGKAQTPKPTFLYLNPQPHESAVSSIFNSIIAPCWILCQFLREHGGFSSRRS